MARCYRYSSQKGYQALFLLLVTTSVYNLWRSLDIDVGYRDHVAPDATDSRILLETCPKKKSGNDDNEIHADTSKDEKRDAFVRNILSALDDDGWAYPEIDIVYTWVNGSDPKWLQAKEKKYAEYMNSTVKTNGSDKNKNKDTKSVNTINRFQYHDELRYSLRSIEKHAPWVRKIFLIVADGQVPSWLCTTSASSKLEIVPHSTIFKNRTHLPTFSSDSIEPNIVNIPDLADYFIFLNDDFFLGQPISPADFLPSKFSGNHLISVTPILLQRIVDLWLGWKITHEEEHCIAVTSASTGALGRRRRRCKAMGQSQPVPGDWVDSNIYVTKMFKREFGHPRLIPGGWRWARHDAYFVSTKMLQDLVYRFQEEYDGTSAHSFRDKEDTQFTFAYYYYLDAVRLYAPSVRQIWRAALKTTQEYLLANLTKSSTNVDLTNLASTFLIGSTPFDWDLLEKEKYEEITRSAAYATLVDCSKEILLHCGYANSITFQRMEQCQEAVIDLHDRQQLRLPIFEIMNRNSSDGTHTNMGWGTGPKFLKTVVSVIRLWSIWMWPTKFVCVNDDMTEPLPTAIAIYHRVMSSLFPKPSIYER